LGICNYSKVSDAVISRASGTNGRSKQMEGAFSIGELAQQVGVNVETIRYYERIGLMARPKRSNAGRRVYHQSGLQTLRFVRHARELGFSLDDIRSLLIRTPEAAKSGRREYVFRHRNSWMSAIASRHRMRDARGRDHWDGSRHPITHSTRSLRRFDCRSMTRIECRRTLGLR
jgi:DNA-binding transcriptional MerR regulator